MAYLHTKITFPTTAALSAAPADVLQDAMWYNVTNAGVGYPTSYQYQASSSEALAAGVVLAVDNGPGRFKIFGGAPSSSSGVGGVTLGAAKPKNNVVPAAIGQIYVEQNATYLCTTQWVATGLTNVDWISTGGTPMVIPYGSGLTRPLPDYVGQLLIAMSGGSYNAQLISQVWIASQLLPNEGYSPSDPAYIEGCWQPL